jgi:hypothetical protein
MFWMLKAILPVSGEMTGREVFGHINASESVMQL